MYPKYSPMVSNYFDILNKNKIQLCKQMYSPLITTIPGYTDVYNIKLEENDNIEQGLVIVDNSDPNNEVIKTYYKTYLHTITYNDYETVICQIATLNFNTLPKELAVSTTAMILKPNGEIGSLSGPINISKSVYMPITNDSLIYTFVISNKPIPNTVAINPVTNNDNIIYITISEIKKVKLIIEPKDIADSVCKIITSTITNIKKHNSDLSILESIDIKLIERLKDIYATKNLTYIL